MRLFGNTVLVAAVVASGFATRAMPADSFYLGTWKIASAVVAPWADGRAHKPDAAEMQKLVGKTVTIAPKMIRAPREVACNGPRYQIKDYPADMLFQGAFGEMHERNKAVDPVKVAASVGFKGSQWKTLETGCAVEIDYHFLDRATAAFGLNDYIYILKRIQ